MILADNRPLISCESHLTSRLDLATNRTQSMHVDGWLELFSQSTFSKLALLLNRLLIKLFSFTFPLTSSAFCLMWFSHLVHCCCILQVKPFLSFLPPCLPYNLETIITAAKMTHCLLCASVSQRWGTCFKALWTSIVRDNWNGEGLKCPDSYVFPLDSLRQQITEYVFWLLLFLMMVGRHYIWYLWFCEVTCCALATQMRKSQTWFGFCKHM